jgi:hypothetical protein
MTSLAENKYIINNIYSPALPLAAMEKLARETLRQGETSPALTVLLARVVLSLLHELRAVRP